MSYTINPNAKNDWVRNAENTMDLSIETDASSVYLDNGRTLEQELGEGSMVSNVATVDSSMSKIIDGTLDGAYESCVLKGKSLVNLFDKSKVSPDHTSYTLGSDNTITYVADNGFTNGVKLNHLKPNTKYALFFDVLAVPQEPNIPYRINDDGTNYNINIFGAGQDNPASGFHSFTTGNDVSDLKFYFYTNLRNVGFKLTLPVIIEYQDGMEDWGIPYFEGICDAKMPILRNTGKNLFYGELEMGGYTGSSGSPYESDIRVRSVEKIFLSKGTYTLSSDGATITIFTIYDLNGVFKKEFVSNNSSCTITLNEDCMAHICVENEKLLSSHIQLEQGSNVTSYEEHKTNILRTSEEIVLRSVGDIKDSYNVLTGEYVQRIVKYVFNGSESEAWNFAEMKGDNYRFGINLPTFGNESADKTALICDRLKVGEAAQEQEQEQITTYNHGSYFELRITLSSSTLASNNVDELRRYLQANPITIQYVVAKPTTAIIEPLSIPFAYENGHIVLESGYEGQSLLPTLEYSTVINRTGRIQSIANTIQKQEKQITKLEQMLIQNIINLDYNNTLLTLKNEMEEML